MSHSAGTEAAKGESYLNLFIAFSSDRDMARRGMEFCGVGTMACFFITLEKKTGLYRKCKNILFNMAWHCYPLLIVMMGWVMFRANPLTCAWHYLLTMSGMETATKHLYKLRYCADMLEVITGAAPVFSRMIETRERSHVRIALVNAWLHAFFTPSALFMEASTYNPFIYSRF